jgi:hypothetical protein
MVMLRAGVVLGELNDWPRRRSGMPVAETDGEQDADVSGERGGGAAGGGVACGCSSAASISGATGAVFSFWLGGSVCVVLRARDSLRALLLA